MRRVAFPLLLATVGFCASPVGAADLTKIERTIAKEPAYKGKPKYCLLVFGDEAKFRAWLVVDDAAVYVDRKGNGDLTEAGERVVGWEAGDIVEPDGKTRHRNLHVFTPRPNKKEGFQLYLWVNGKHTQYAGYDQEALMFADRPQDAPIIHFGGPLAFRISAIKPEGSRRHVASSRALSGGQEFDLTVRLGTPGLGKGTFADLNCLAIPKNVHPAGTIVFPPQSPDGEPITAELSLKPTGNEEEG